MKRFILGVVAGIAATLLGGFILCEVAEHCDLPLEAVSYTHLTLPTKLEV